jgi:hypothetical protein
VGGTSGTSTGGTGTGGSSGSTSGGSTTGGSTSGGAGGAGASTGGASGAATGGAMSGAGGKGGTGGSAAGMGGTMAGAGMGGKGGTGGTMAGAGMGGTMAGAGMGGSGGTGGTAGMPGGVLAHRYSFTETGMTATDSVGTAHGTIVGGSQANGVVTLAGGTTDQYVQLPPNVLTGLTTTTFEVWSSWTGGTQNWQRIFDFGLSDAGAGMQGGTNTTSPYIFLTPRADATNNANNPNCINTTAARPRAAITTAGPVSETCAFGTAAFPTGTLTHIAVTVDGSAMTLYIGGTAVGGPVGLGVGISAIAGYDNNWLGRSQFSNDAEYGGTISEFRIYASARTAAQITASAAAGPDSVPTQ